MAPNTTMPTLMPTVYSSPELYQGYQDTKQFAFDSELMKHYVENIRTGSSGKKKGPNPVIIELKDILPIFPTDGLKELADKTEGFIVLITRKIPVNFSHKSLMTKFRFFDKACEFAGFGKKEHLIEIQALQDHPSIWLFLPFGITGYYNIFAGVSFAPADPDVFIQFWVWPIKPDHAKIHYKDGTKPYPEHLRLHSFFLVLIQQIMQMATSSSEEIIPKIYTQVDFTSYHYNKLLEMGFHYYYTDEWCPNKEKFPLCRSVKDLPEHLRSVYYNTVPTFDDSDQADQSYDSDASNEEIYPWLK